MVKPISLRLRNAEIRARAEATLIRAGRADDVKRAHTARVMREARATVERAMEQRRLKRVAALALTTEKFASIASKAREGNFLDTTLPLTGWSDCSLYGAGTYTCDSPGLTSARAAEQAQAETLRDIAACFGDSWTQAHDRSSANYVVLHSRAAPLSITLSTDQTEKDGHVVRLILFVRRNQVGQ